MWNYCGANYDLENILEFFSTLVSYHLSTADYASITNHVTDILSKIESTMPNAAIIII